MPGVPGTSSPGHVRSFPVVAPTQANRVVAGISRDVTGTALGACTVKLYDNATDVMTQSMVSDASGNYSFAVDPTLQWYVRFYLAGSSDVAGTTKNGLVGV